MADLKDVLLKDLSGQRDLARQALEGAKKIEAAQGSDVDELKAALEDAKQTLLKVASGLAANTTSTSTSVMPVIKKF